MKQFYLLPLLTVMLISCQDNENKSNEIAKNATSTTTEKTATVSEVKEPEWTDEELRIHQEKIEVGKEKLKLIFNNQIDQHKKALGEAELNLQKINEFEFGRSQATKDKQLSEHFEMLKIYRETLENLQKEYVEIPLNKTFDFQKSPNGLMTHIFYGFKNKDFNKFKYLYDPYVEGGEVALWLCNIKALPDYKRIDFYKEFQNPRIMGDAKIEGNKAIIEIALGPSSDRLEKVELVKRLDKWYLSSI
jgi:hypothetical protein